MRSGQLIAGRYRLKEQVGTGGDGIVWRAVDEQLGRVVAVKRALSEDSDRGPERVRLLRREAEILAQLNHPNIVTLFDLVAEGIEWWLVMEYVASRSLAEQGALAPEKVARFGAQIADALEAVHAAGVLHRDIKPGNVLVTGDDRAKLGDFGISRAVWADETLTDAGGLFIGTPGYAAPELARGEADPSPASDVFSLGATLYAAVEGRSPFGTAENPRVLLRRAERGAVAPAERAGALASALSALLRADPAERPTVSQARQMLEAVAEPGRVTVTTRDGPRLAAVGDRGHHWRRIGFAGSEAVRDHARRWRHTGSGAARPHPTRAEPSVAAGSPPARPATSRRRIRWGLVAVAAGAAVALVAGLAYWPFGTRHDRPSPPPSRSVGAFGDPRTADPCGLVDPAALRSFGRTELATDYGNFNRCDVIVRSGRSEVDTEIELDNASPDEEPGRVERVGALGVVREASNGDECDRTVLAPGKDRVFVTAQQDGDGRADLCGIADAATAKVVAVLSRGPVPRRTAHPNPASLINVDACSLLDGAALARFPGVDALHPEPGFGGWRCRWNSTTSPAMLDLIFDRNEPLNADDGRPVQAGGHQAFVQPNGYGEKTCLASVVHRQFVDSTGARTAELLLVVVTSEQSPERRCSLATALAGPAAARLPRP